MCGFTGFLDRTARELPEILVETVGRMNQTLSHRGPDDQGIWTDASQGIALAHRRLSILDLSPEGHQPMMSRSSRYVIAFNGEIYNHLELRAALDSVGTGLLVHPLADEASRGPTAGPWRGRSDTETLLAAIDTWGIGEALKRTVGMFAFALWDRHDHLLYLARDRLGEKPIYYGWQDNFLLFGSELKALRQHPAFQGQVDRGAMTLQMRHGYIPAPYSIYQGISKLPPGTYIALGSHRPNAQPVTYWSALDTALKGQMQPFQGTDQDAIDALDTLLRKAVQGQMVADVPLGAFLSGGIDSSTIVALMQAQSGQPVKTFTIGFNEQEYNEATHAKAIAAHLGTDHTELYVTPEEAMAVIPDLPALYDEPFADSSQIPTHLVSRLARQKVAVSLSGDGGDELFGGYNRYFWTTQFWRKMRRVPKGLRSSVAGLLTVVPPHLWDGLFRMFGFAMPASLRYASPGDKLHKLSSFLGASNPEEIYLDLVSLWKNPRRLALGTSEPKTLLNDPHQWPELRDFEHRMMYLDTVTYLPDDILTKVDRAAMGVSLETRVPLLDHRIVEFAWQLPLSMKIREGQGKWVLRQVLNRYIPETLTERPKMGFGVPIDQWLRGPLKPWAEELIDKRRLKSEGFLNPNLVRDRWNQHQSGRQNWSYLLWNVLMFEAWLDSTR